ncbi:ABC transporter ATP-binding protein [Pyxidicoccus trucidator]|uniref:ABC transporter ATP-binding protein n=1 Tax=Pyxidicoccus trucidator TaxID=2709662 RepID=UPI0013DD4A75|nr:ABC transporter ATP-binding protein [Pyxidicoccus trucidator]
MSQAPAVGKRNSAGVWRAIRYLSHYRGATVGALVALLLASAANLAAPQFVRMAIDQGITKGDRHTMRVAVVALLGIALARGLFNFLQSYLSESASQGVAYDLRGGLFARIQKLSFSYYDQAQTGQLLTRLTSDVDQVRMFVGVGVIQLAASVVMLVGATGLLLSLNPLLAVCALLAIAPILWALRRFVRVMGPMFGRVQMALGKLNVVLQESLRGVRLVRAFSAEPRQTERYNALTDELLEENLKLIDVASINIPVVNFFANLGTITVVVVGGFLVFGGRLTVGELIAFNSYLGFLLMPIMTTGFIAAQMSRANASALRVFELLDTPIELADAPDAVALPPLSGRVELKDVHFRYAGAEKEILRGVSFQADAGALVAIVGTTGSGKSTIINLVPRFYDVTSGEVLIDGHDVRKVSTASLRSQIGVVLQDALLFSGTVRANIAYGKPDATLEQVRAAAAAAQAAEFIEALPDQYDTVVGERGVGLSGGQRQRLAIARALLTEPNLLILDDSTSAVDAQTEALIQRALDALMRDKHRTAIVIAQRLSTVRDADLIVVLDEGKVVAQGRHQELVQTSELYNQIVGSQLQPESKKEAVA